MSARLRALWPSVPFVVNVGDEIVVKCVEIDSQGRINLSRKVVLTGEDGDFKSRDRGDRGNRGHRDGHRR